MREVNANFKKYCLGDYCKKKSKFKFIRMLLKNLKIYTKHINIKLRNFKSKNPSKESKIYLILILTKITFNLKNASK